MGGQHPCRGHGFCPSLLPSSWHWDEGKYLENSRARLASDRAGSLSEAGINLKEFTGGVCGRENSLLISHSYGHLLRTVCSVSNSLIKINIKQIENIPRRGCLICWRILQQTSQSTQKTPDHGKRPGGHSGLLGPPSWGWGHLRWPWGISAPSPRQSGRAASFFIRIPLPEWPPRPCPARWAQACAGSSALGGADQSPPPTNIKASINGGRVRPSCRAQIRIEISLGKWICVWLRVPGGK